MGPIAHMKNHIVDHIKGVQFSMESQYSLKQRTIEMHRRLLLKLFILTLVVYAVAQKGRIPESGSRINWTVDYNLLTTL